MQNTMFRYLEKYVGIYRVLAPIDLDTKDFPKDDKGHIIDSFDDLYIPCTKGIIKHSYIPKYLVWYTNKINLGRKMKLRFESNKIEIAKYEETDGDILIWFDEKELKKVASLVKPKTVGKGINPYSARNLNDDNKIKYEIPKSDLDKYSSIFQDLPLGEKLKFTKAIIKEFDKIVVKTKGKDYNINEERNISGLSNKDFIHSIGMWDEFIKFTKKEYKKFQEVKNGR